jgi:hypothetical protein
MTLEGRSPLCIVGNKMCFASRFGNNICVHDNTRANNFKKLGDLQVGIKRTQEKRRKKGRERKKKKNI